ncbi:MAG TPA: hypothetical protein VFH61_12235 [Thermoleophilia bacterium]|nr:hypothetical protein [Thermoleophilia bacterium]
MEHQTNRKIVQIEEHVVTFGRMDLVEALDAELASEGVMVTPSRTSVCVAVGKDALVDAERLMMMLRTVKEDIPENAELVLAVRWREEVSSNAVSPAGLPVARVAGTAGPAPVINPSECATCGSVPAIVGPTPDCADESGCARVRRQKGEMPIARTVEPDGASGIGHRAPPGILINRETGKRAFADQTGNPYGNHDYDS